jgi:hypothetical protein
MCILFMFKMYVLYYFMKESITFCIRVLGTHLIELHYNSSFIYVDSIYAGITRNLTLV